MKNPMRLFYNVSLFASVALLLGFFTVATSWSAGAQTVDDPFAAALQTLNEKSFKKKAAAIEAMAEFGDPRATAALEALAAGHLFSRKSDKAIVIGSSIENGYALTDPVSGAGVGDVGKRDVKKITVNNRLRGQIRGILGRLALSSEDAAQRLTAAQNIIKSPSPGSLDLLRDARDRETVGKVRDVLETGIAIIELESDDTRLRLAAIQTLSGSTDREVKALLERMFVTDDAGDFAEADADVRAAAQAAIDDINGRLSLLAVAENLLFGISLGSVLLLAAIGLAVTFGVMGVINMAHGEMIMLGAYTTFLVQEIFRTVAPPEAFGLYVVAAIPAAFLVAGAFGVLIERGCIRFLYGRPLETLLATWGISLILQQLVRSLFGANNREVANPQWLSGALELGGGVSITFSRIYIIFFCLAVVALLAAFIRYSRFGLNMRAVTQNRAMASSMGIKTGQVDALTFALGSGIAGIAGVALSQISNVSPNLGQNFIVDSFMVVVFGGVGSLWGTIVGAFGLGIVNKFLEPFSGAILGKVVVLIIIILFIQKRPRGLFALKGRAAEA
jgi:urea transport system permease protein